MKIKKIPTLTLNFSLLLPMNMEFGTQIDDEYTYKLCKKRNYCLKSGIKKYIFLVEILRFCMTDKFSKNNINVDIH
jgi:hypothetical protein